MALPCFPNPANSERSHLYCTNRCLSLPHSGSSHSFTKPSHSSQRCDSTCVTMERASMRTTPCASSRSTRDGLPGEPLAQRASSGITTFTLSDPHAQPDHRCGIKVFCGVKPKENSGLPSTQTHQAMPPQVCNISQVM